MNHARQSRAHQQDQHDYLVEGARYGLEWIWGAEMEEEEEEQG